MTWMFVHYYVSSETEFKEKLKRQNLTFFQTKLKKISTVPEKNVGTIKRSSL